MSDGTGLAEALLGLPGFRVLEVTEDPAEVVIRVGTTVEFTGCSTCGVRAESQDRMPVEIRDLAYFGRPARLVWNKRRWRCREPPCGVKTWTEQHPEVSSRVVVTRLAGMDACRQVGECARPVSGLAAELGVCWWTVMGAVREHGEPLVDDPDRVGTVRQLGVDETSFLAATRDHPMLFVTGLVDLERHILIDMTEGNSAADLRRWCAAQDTEWLKAVKVVATDLTSSYRAGLSPHLDHVTRVAD